MATTRHECELSRGGTDGRVSLGSSPAWHRVNIPTSCGVGGPASGTSSCLDERRLPLGVCEKPRARAAGAEDRRGGSGRRVPSPQPQQLGERLGR